MYEICSYKEIRTYVLLSFLKDSAEKFFSDYNFQKTFAIVFYGWDGVYNEKIEKLMLDVVLLISTGGWDQKTENYLRCRINHYFSENDFWKEFKKINFNDACELIQDIQQLNIPLPFHLTEYQPAMPRGYGVVNLTGYIKKNKAVGLWTIQVDIATVFWVGCRDYGFSGWTYEQVCEWTYNKLNNRYAYKIENLMLKVAILGLTGGWCKRLEGILRGEINQLLPTMNLEEELKNVEWNHDEEVERALVITMKELRVIY